MLVKFSLRYLVVPREWVDGCRRLCGFVVADLGYDVGISIRTERIDAQHFRVVTYGLLNLTHRNGHDSPERLVPGEKYTVTVAMNGVAHAFAPGHRLRVSISTSYWPLAWPPPEAVRLEIQTSASALALPVRPRAASDDMPVRAFDDPEGTQPMEVSQLLPGKHDWTVSRDLVDYTSRLEVVKDLGKVRIEDVDLDITRRSYERYTAVADDFVSVRGETDWTMGFQRDGWAVRTDTHTTLESTTDEFILHAQLDAYEDSFVELATYRATRWAMRHRFDGQYPPEPGVLALRLARVSIGLAV